MRNKNVVSVIVIILVVSLAVIWLLVEKNFWPQNSSRDFQNSKKQVTQPQTLKEPDAQLKFSLPISNFKEGQTKKVFGQYITPQNSPVQPEKFTGYHTGIDIEVEQNESDVPVYAISDGTLIFAGRVGGYGGVLIYETAIDNQATTILYGHIRMSSVTKKTGDKISKGEKLAVLGSPKSSETEGERKHLHFAIHKGGNIEYRGYVSEESQLAGWINPNTLFK